MTRLRLDYIHEFHDRHGKVRRYFRRPGSKQIPLPGLPGSEEFMAAYLGALAGVTAPRLQIGASRTMPGTVNAAIVGYYQCGAFTSLAPLTQQNRRAILERFRDEHGNKRIATLPQDFILRTLGKRSPSAARNLLKTLRGLLAFAIAQKFRVDDPTQGIKLIRMKNTGGHLAWSEDQVTTYRSRHPLGTRARLALEILIGTGQRRGDVVRMGRQHVRDGVLSIKQSKTGNLVEIPVLPELQVALDAMPGEQLTYLTTQAGAPFTAAGFGGWFRERCNEAGILKGYAAHGLRKAAATRHANAGATAHELMAWFGWTSISEAERYTKAADRKRLAQGMVKKLRTGTSSGKPQ